MSDHRRIDIPALSSGQIPDPTSDLPLLTGTAAVVARRLRVSPLAVRAAFVVGMFAGGMGVVLYGACWLVLVRAPEQRGEVVRVSTAGPPTRSDPWRTFGFGALVTAAMALAIASGWARPGLVWPTLLVAAGVVIAWAPPRSGVTGEAMAGDRSSSGHGSGDALGRDVLRQVGGTVLVLAGLLVLVADRLSWSLLVDGAVTGLVVLVGVALVLGPWMLRTGRASIEERRERVRAEEREAVAAHLHDSVLQTLTLIQKRSADPDADPRVVAALARRQERELRRWLYGSTDGWEPDARLRDAIDATVADVEDLHGVTIESVMVGDVGIDDRVAALVAATREALVNAAKFSGCRELALFVEVSPSATTVFVRDRGVGFDPTRVPADRHGIRDSIVGRLVNVDGAAVVHSEAGAGAGSGTEVVLTLPAVSPSASAAADAPGGSR